MFSGEDRPKGGIAVGTRSARLDLSLLQKIRSGDMDAKEKLVKKYIPMVKHIARNHYAPFLDFDDLMQEGLIGLLSAIDEYNPHKFDVKFSSFAYMCIVRKIYNVIKQTNGNKHRALNDAISLQSYVNSDDTRTVLDLIPLDSKMNPEQLVEAKFVNERINEILTNHLSLLEYAVIILVLRGYTCGEIEQEIGVNSKAVDNARTRVKAKLRRILGKYGSLLNPEVPVQVRRRRDLYMDVQLTAL